MENTVVVDDYAKMDKILREERNYILQTIKKIRTTGCNVLLIQKSILRDAVTDLSLHYLVRVRALTQLLPRRMLSRQTRQCHAQHVDKGFIFEKQAALSCKRLMS
jgi:chaperonin GroEL (HSP60 family)